MAGDEWTVCTHIVWNVLWCLKLNKKRKKTKVLINSLSVVFWGSTFSNDKCWDVVAYENGYIPVQESDTPPQTTSSLSYFLFPDTFEMVSEDEDGKVMFKVNYHYMSQVKNASDTNSAARSRRLAQEAVTLSTSLPLSSSSSVFVRCDEERLDIMKVKCYFNFTFHKIVVKCVNVILWKCQITVVHGILHCDE